MRSPTPGGRPRRGGGAGKAPAGCGARGLEEGRGGEKGGFRGGAGYLKKKKTTKGAAITKISTVYLKHVIINTARNSDCYAACQTTTADHITLQNYGYHLSCTRSSDLYPI